MLEQRLILQCAGEGIIGLDHRHVIVYSNDAACALVGWTEDELRGRPMHETLHHSHPDGSPYPVEECPLHSAGRGDHERIEDTTVLWRRDGTALEVDLTLTPLRDGERRLGAVLVFADTSGRRQAASLLAEERQRRIDQLEALSILGRMLAECEDADAVAAAVTRCGRAVTGADCAALLHDDPDAELSPECSWHTVPVQRRGRLLGSLALGWRHPVGPAPEELQYVLEVLASEAACALTRAEMMGSLRTAALTDSLTGLPNRRAWEEQVAREHSRFQRSTSPYSVAVLDLDHFKAYNDCHGHQAGDELIAAAARAFSARLRTGDFLARYGGEEYTLLLADCVLGEAVDLVQRIRRAVPGGVTCSAGVCQARPGDGPTDAFARADAALYRAKAAGRDQVAT